jgi:hypothetical protein
MVRARGAGIDDERSAERDEPTDSTAGLYSAAETIENGCKRKRMNGQFRG